MIARTPTFSLAILAFLALASFARAFTIAPAARTGAALASRRTAARRATFSPLRMSEQQETEKERAVMDDEEAERGGQDNAGADDELPQPKAEFGQAGFFMPNENMRYGTSRDQDGKSNVWAVEPKMKVEDGENKGAAVGTGVAILVAAIAAVALTISNLPSVDSY